MSAVERLSSYITRGVCTVWGPFHPFGGAVDIIAVQQPDGSFKSSPWYVKFGKFQGMLKRKEKIVNISVNGVEAGFHMYLNHRGEAYFLKEVDGNEKNSDFLSPSSSNTTDEQSHNGRLVKAEDLNLDNTRSDMATHVNESNGKMMAKTKSQQSRIFGLMFGQKSMKDNNRLRKGGISMERISSLERAEIAADLLEMKWSTNLPTNSWKVKHDFKPSTPKKKEEETSEDVKVSDKGSPTVVTTDFDQISQLRSHEQILLPHPLEATDFADSRKIISELPAQKINEVGEDNTSSDVMAMQSAFQANSLDSEDGPLIHSNGFMHSNIEQASDRIDVPVKHYVYRKECGDRRVSSNHSRVGFDVYSDAAETRDFSSGGYEEVHASSELLYGTSTPMLDRISKDNSEQESGMPMGTENLNGRTHRNLGLSRSEDYCCHDSNASNAIEAVSENSLEKSTDDSSSMGDFGQTITESCTSIDTCLLSLKSIENETTELAQDETGEKFTPEKTLEMVATFENQCQIISLTNHLSGDEVINEKASNKPASSVQMDEDDITCDSTASELGHLINQFQEAENCGEGVKTREFHLSCEIIIGLQQDSMVSSPSELANSIMQSSDSTEEQLPTRNIDNFGLVSADTVGMGSHRTEDIEEEQGLNDTYLEMSASSSQSFESRSFSTTSPYPEELVHDSSPDTIEVFPEEVRTRLSPICIPRGQLHLGEIKQYIGSLPNIRSHMHDIECCDVQQPLSRSLDVSSGNPYWAMLGDVFSSTSSTKETFESHVVQDNPTKDVTAAVVGTLGTREHEGISTTPAVELSLCKHLLFEGMGAEAASQAFDAEKVDLDKFKDLGPSIVKNDSLIVRISEHYFPWDAAAPIILGMVSFGQDYILKPEGMIAVDQAEQTPISESSRTIAPSGGGWKLWPFRFKKTKIVSSLPSPDTMKGTDAENASEDSPDRSVNKTKAKKKKGVRSIIPTSEQLASLNLKEGQNVITFTFSTAMLGRQQVDARIYLWKWNTRIVVSDVDGTITKSDVLGQFMPLVGRDWSQIGVAHLFSAIKENGYELLFLSARAISQASLTRQFLFNLKQDGKALPNGPVVISPDGLFPSLFREVIRRAPHEFKIACLEDIKALFPPDCNPFYAGFGNRDTDEISYLKIGIPKSKIFIINPKGEVVVNRRFNTKTYSSLHSLVNGMFPPTMSAEQEDYNSWNYWKIPLPDITF